MRITLNYFGQLRQFADKETEARDCVDGTGLVSLLEQATQDYGPEFGNVLLDGNSALRPSVMVLVNETPVDKEAPPSLSDGDAVSLLAAIAGG